MIVAWTIAAEAQAPAERKGPPVDVATLFDVHGAFLLRSLGRLVPDESVVEDIAQEVFLIAHKKRHELDAEKNLAAWLYRVGVNIAWHHKRTFARRARLRDDVETAAVAVVAEGDPERAAADKQQALRLRACLAKLPREQREVFALFELEEKSGEDTAAILGVPVATVWTRLHRARAKMRRAWIDSDGGADA